jgi:hypothetical protein
VETEVGDGNVWTDEVARRVREEHLAAVGRGGDPCSLHDVETDVSLGDPVRLAGVQAHPDANRLAVERALCIRRSGNGIRRAPERDEERVALRVDLDAVALAEHGPERPPVLHEPVGVGPAELLHQPRLEASTSVNMSVTVPCDSCRIRKAYECDLALAMSDCGSRGAKRGFESLPLRPTCRRMRDNALMGDDAKRLRDRVRGAIEAPVSESERLLNDLPSATTETRLSIQISGWGRGLAAALEEIAIAVDELQSQAGRQGRQPRPQQRIAQAADSEQEETEQEPPRRDDLSEASEEQVLEAARRSREETVKLREDAEAIRRELDR